MSASLIGDERALEDIAHRMRVRTVEMLSGVGSGHWGGSLSAVEILTCLYFGIMRVDPKNPSWPDRDRFVASKGHVGPALYPILAEKGFFPHEMLSELDKPGGRLTKHVDRFKCPGVDLSAGCLGQGLSAGAGMAAAAKLDRRDYRVFVLLGDGELDSGQIWEAAMAATKYRLDNLIAIVDRNSIQLDGSTDTAEEIMPLEPLADKWRAFGWEVRDVDGHSIPRLLPALREPAQAGRPLVVIARTVKGKGISFMEGKKEWHHRAISPGEAKQAMAEVLGKEKAPCRL